MAAYSIVKSAITDRVSFAIVSDENNAKYVHPGGKEGSGLNDSRVQRLSSLKDQNPRSESGWIRLLMTNVGYNVAQPLVEVDTIEQAEKEALLILNGEK